MPKTLLIADDEKDIVEISSRTAEMVSYNVLTAYNGQEAETKLNQADVYLFDINMPEISGLELLAKIKSDSHAHKPVIMMTGKTTEEQLRKINELKADGYLLKPFSLIDLIKELKNFIINSKSH